MKKIFNKFKNINKKSFTFKLPSFKKIFKIKPKKKEKPHTLKYLEVGILLGLTAFICLTVGIFSTIAIQNGTDHIQKSEYSATMKDFLKNYKYIKDNYYGDFNEKIVLDSAIKGVLQALNDPYSEFLDDIYAANFEISLRGSFQGVGVEIINTPTKQVKIVGVFEGSPAEKAGIKVNDIILSINGIDMTNKTTVEVVTYIKTAKSNDFSFKVLRDNVEQTIAVSKTLVIIKSVTSKTFNLNNKKIGYIRVDIFSATTYNQFKVALTALEKEGINSLIIDLRGNSGGHLSIVQDMTSLFLSSKHMIYQTQDATKNVKIYSTGKVDKTYPIIFLADGESASASELMIGALKDGLNAKIVGETTYGKGTVQELQDLSNGNSYKFTTKKWLTPKGTWVHKVGITPDTVVKLADIYKTTPTDANDNQLQTALEQLSK